MNRELARYGWIQTADKMPKIGLHVLVWANNMISIGYYDSDGVFWIGEAENTPEYFVTHWMLLPDAPGEDTQDE